MVQPIVIQRKYSLSPMQTGMLLFSAGAERPLYVMQMSCRLPYQIDITVFTQAWQWAVDRHEALRTGFIWSDVDEPLQEVHQAAQIKVRLESIESLSPAEQSAWLTDFADRDLNQPFDLGSPPLIRVALIRLAEADFFLLFTAHHCVFDGRSRQIVIDEVFRYYDGLRVGIKAKFPPAPRYETFVSWVLAQEFVDAKEYWQNLLKSCDSSSVLQNFLRSGPVSLPDSIQNYVLPISREMSDRCHSCAKQLQVTVNTIVQACWALLLHRWSSQANITFGNTRACRRVPVEGAQSMVGLLINSLPCFVHLGSTTKVIEVLEDLRAQHLTVRPYEATPLQLIRQWTGLGEHLCDTSVVFESWHPNYLPGLAASGSRPIEVTRRANSHYRLMLFGYGQPSLTLEIEYDACWIHPFTIEQIARHYITLMDAVISDPNITVAEIRMLTDEERNQVLNWGRRRSNNLRGNVPEWFKEEAGRRWDAVAVEYGEEQLSYAELNRRSNQLARYLRKRGVGAEVLVGICLERSLEMVIAVLGILKAGGGYVALDPDYPRERLRYMMEDAGIRVVLSGKSFEGLMPERGMEVISLEREGKVWQEAGEEEGSDVAVWVDGENLAYVSYTSGSTGKPKGVGIPHRAIVRLVKGADYVDLHEGDVWLQLAPVVFDASTFEIWGSLLNGGRLVVYEAGIPTLEGIGRVLREKQVTVLWLTAGLFQQMVEQERESLRGVRELLAGGDVLGVEAVRRALGAGCEVINGYGPTENTTFTCCYRVPREGWPGTTVPIGAPINCTEVYVLDEYLEPVPVGVVGELYMGGRGLARGYQGRAELTAEKFIPNRFSREGGERLYRSGDRVRWLGEGVLEFCGRRDDQVKVRGFRIELREIEAVLQELEEVEQAVVTVREDTAAGKQLVAYVVPRRKIPELEALLRDHLQQKLPPYMLPSVFVEMETLPLSSNGKVARQALPRPSLAVQPMTRIGRDPTEEILAGIWADVLGCSSIDREDDFFKLGGHSLLAMKIVSRIREALRTTIPIRAVFEFPTIGQMAEKIRTSGSAQSLQAARIGRVERGKPLPASFAQQRLYFLQQYEPSTVHYNVPIRVRFSGPLNVPAFAQAVNKIVRRHEALRTRFTLKDDLPIQLIDAPPESTLQIADLQAVPAPDREHHLERIGAEHGLRPFDLGNGPLLWATLVVLSAQEHVFLLTIHHAAIDAWSLEIFANELETLYGYFSGAHRSTLPEPAIQYADFAVWQRQSIRGAVLEEQLAYWRGQLAGLQEMELPTAPSRRSRRSHAGACYDFNLAPGLAGLLRETARCEGVTLLMAAMAAVKALLYRYSGQSDIAIGTPIAGRNRAELEGLIGLFLNMIVLRTTVSGALGFQSLLRSVRDVALPAYAHQDAPFEKLVEELQPKRDPDGSMLFQVMLTVNSSQQDWKLAGIDATAEHIRNLPAKFDLSLSLTCNGEGLQGCLHYRRELFDDLTIARMSGHLQRLLSYACENPMVPVDDLPLLGEAERRQVLVQWNDTSTTVQPGQSLHELFAEQVRRTPQRVAIVDGERHVTYQQLNRMANWLARLLRQEKVQPEAFVGICLKRSIEMAVSMLAVLKTGAAYVPLDPQYPSERLKHIIKDSGLRMVITTDALKERVLAEAVSYLLLDQCPWDALEPKLPDEHCFSIPNSAAYVIYTSGSSGVPKGVVGLQGSTVNRLAWQWNAYPFPDDEACCLKTPVGFVDSVAELFGPLLQGIRLIVADDPTVLDLQVFVELLTIHGVTRITVVPAFLRELLGHLLESSHSPRSMRIIVSSGEALAGDLADMFAVALPHVTLLNFYGSSEVAADATCAKLSGEYAREAVTIGQPVANVKVYVLDARLNPAPIGVTGEICIGGMGLARGYLHQPDLTADRFIPDPFCGMPGSRMYRTGDLGRWSGNGELEFAGRRDLQVKVRGCRIELSEVEDVIRKHQSVQDAVVVVTEDNRLAAFLVAKTKGVFGTRDVRNYLKARLPDYMVPSSIAWLSELPLTASGKVDRRAVFAMPTRDLPEQGYVEPQTHTQAVLAAIWADVLKLERVGIHDDYFDYGGNSLLAMRLMARTSRKFHVDLPLSALFAEPTVAQLSHRIDAAVRGSGTSGTAPITRARRNGEATLSFLQEGYLLNLWWLNRRTGRPLAPFNLAFGVHLYGDLNVTALQEAVNEVVKRHEILRTTFHGLREDGIRDQYLSLIENALKKRGGGTGVPLVDLWGTGLFRAALHPHLQVEISIANVEELAAEDRYPVAEEVVMSNARSLIDFERPPLLHPILVKLDTDHHLFAIVIHHVIADPLALRTLQKELLQSYSDHVAGCKSSLPELEVQYSDFAQWERNRLQGETLTRMGQDWKTQWDEFQADFLQANHFPFALPKPKVAVRDCGLEVQEFGLQGSLKMSKFARANHITLHILCLAAWTILAHSYTGKKRIAIWNNFANRTQAETQDMIGCFASSQIIGLDVSDDPTVFALLQRARDVLLARQANQELTPDLAWTTLITGMDSLASFPPDGPYVRLETIMSWEQDLFKVRDLVAEPARFKGPIAGDSLSLLLRGSEHALELLVHYSIGWFKAEDIRTLLADLQRMIHLVIDTPDVHLSQLAGACSSSNALGLRIEDLPL